MAFQNAEAIQKLYVAFFNRPADYYGLQYWDGVIAKSGNADAVIASFAATFAQSKEYTDTYAGQNNRQIINNIYKNLFGRPAEEAGLEYWNAEIGAGRVTLSNAVLMISGGAQNADKIAYASKVTAATSFTDALDTTDERLGYAGEKANAVAKQFLTTVTDAASLATAIIPANLDKTVNESIGAGQTATTYQLTKGLDNVPGTSGNDVIIGSIDSDTNGNAELNTLSSVDVINGGAGVDTLKINHASSKDGVITFGNVTNVEVIEITSAYNTSATGAADGKAGVVVNTTAATGVTDLNIVRAVDAIEATAGATTNVGVSLKDVAGIGTIDIAGGKNVNVALTDAQSAIKVGVGAAADATGAVTISATGAASVNNTDVTMGDIAVTGGTTISVTQKATVNSAAIIADGTTEDVVQGNVTIIANAATTDVTVKQDATNDGSASRTAITGATEVATVKFVALKAGESVTVAGLTFTAAKALTAAEVAQAFANVSTAAIKPTQLDGFGAPPATGAANGDTNGSSVTANGTFKGSLTSVGFLADGSAGSSSWTSGAANGDTVTFTGRANTNQTDITASATTSTGTAALTVNTTTQGVTARGAWNDLGITAGAVAITGEAALKSVTVDGYDGASGISNGATGANAALATVTLANGGSFGIDSAAATLALNATDVDGTVTVSAGTKTLNANIVGADSDVVLVSGSVEAVNVKGDGNVSGTTAAGGLDKATAINTSAMTAGTATFTIDNGTTTSYTGGAAADKVTIANAGTAITKAVTLGAGNDTLTLQGTVVLPTATLSGGEGTDTIGMTGASAAAMSANADFAGKIDGFEKLAITDTVTTATTVNMANMDGITYVVTNGSSATSGSAGAPQVYSFNIAGMNATDGQTLVVGGKTVFTATPVAPATTVDAATIAADINGDTVTIGGVDYTISATSTAITLTSTASVAAQPAITVAVGGTAAGAGATPPSSTVVAAAPGSASSTGGVQALTIDKLAANGTVELVETSAGVIVKMADATGTADTLNIVTTVVGTAKNFGTVSVDGVETIKINAVDAQPTVSGQASIQRGTLALDADAAKSVTIAGNSHVTLSLTGDSKLVTTVDASTLTGNLTFTASGAKDVVAVTVTGGAGADILKASVGVNAVADVLNGGAGADTLYAGSNGAKLTGGDGNDLFIVSGATGATPATFVGNKEGNTYSEITDFKAGDLLQLQAFKGGTIDAATGLFGGATAADVASLAKLTATLNETTATFSNFVDAAIKQADLGAAVWFNYKGDLYVVIDNHDESVTFENGADLIVKLTGINGDNLTFNTDFGTAALI